MRWLLSSCLLALLSLVQALSSSGNRLLVVIEEAAEKSKFSKFWTDLEGDSCRFEKKGTLVAYTVREFRARLQALF
jgi:hypothetical protein